MSFSTEWRPLCRPSVDGGGDRVRITGIDRHSTVGVSRASIGDYRPTRESVDAQPTIRLLLVQLLVECRPVIARHVDRLAANMSTDSRSRFDRGVTSLQNSLKRKHGITCRRQ